MHSLDYCWITKNVTVLTMYSQTLYSKFIFITLLLYKYVHMAQTICVRLNLLLQIKKNLISPGKTFYMLCQQQI
jgi:hypothetical protein